MEKIFFSGLLFIPATCLCGQGSTAAVSEETCLHQHVSGSLGGERRPRACLGSCRWMIKSWRLELRHIESQVEYFCSLLKHSSSFVVSAVCQAWSFCNIKPFLKINLDWSTQCWNGEHNWIYQISLERALIWDYLGVLCCPAPGFSSLMVTRVPPELEDTRLISWNAATSSLMSQSVRTFLPRKYGVLTLILSQTSQTVDEKFQLFNWKLFEANSNGSSSKVTSQCWSRRWWDRSRASPCYTDQCRCSLPRTQPDAMHHHHHHHHHHHQNTHLGHVGHLAKEWCWRGLSLLQWWCRVWRSLRLWPWLLDLSWSWLGESSMILLLWWELTEKFTINLCLKV